MKTIEEERAYQRRKKSLWRAAHPEHKVRQVKYYREWYEKNGRSRTREQMDWVAVWQDTHPEAMKAMWTLERYIRRGIVSRPKYCSLCGRRTKVHAHHQNYSKPLEVIWLCASCHRKIHLGEEIDVRGYQIFSN